MSFSQYGKRRKTIETSLVKFPKRFNSFTLNINTNKFVDHNHSPVNFKYVIQNQESVFFKNGALNLSAGDEWEVALLRLIMPNNIISFPSISAGNNLNSAYLVMSFSLSYKVRGNNELIDKVIEIPFFLPHEKFTVPELIIAIKKGIETIFDFICNPNESGFNVTTLLFFSSCFHIFIDPSSKFIAVKSINYNKIKENPFYNIFNKFFKSEKMLKKK